MCHGVFKKKHFPIHVSALCEEGVMSCGRCAGTYKRKYKEYHDCVRHLQNCMKTMNEEIQLLKADRDLRDKKFKEEVRLMVQAMMIENNSSTPFKQV